MTALSWVEVAQQQQPMSQARMRAEMHWRIITGKAPGILDTFGDLPRLRPEPIAPRGRGKLQPKPAKPVLVETRKTRMLICPDGRVIATKRRVQTYIAA